MCCRSDLRIMVIGSPAHACREPITPTSIEENVKNITDEKGPRQNKNYEVKITLVHTSETPGQSLTCFRSA